mmetsp:Transcript_44537/g.93455  ORF Transcript_44537/g.93455 Transcript_44537/m.93455 type:complete len:408 (-) Transcript_44537:418-1641(-)|eukprot:CAMPEP_0183714850 /NCGR_PEP_ID=MMETSP0737-20130205/9269_1 /TAXON_ID=385413 /ORGANISM="Thalassiosira miniscula, Strain CCMP1093" /LENGTH=407 /DNA_ID=CAMNT_0025943865 /DNA_START=198 /DNA_END=1421 /DNA_ORIENTATION=+
MAPTALCGSVISSRRSFLALAWTLTTLLSVFSFGVSVFLGAKITNQYNSMLTEDYAEWYRDEYGRDYYYNNQNRNNNNNWDCRRSNRRERYLNSGDNNNGNNNNGNSADGNNNHEGEEDGREGCHSNDHAELDEDFFESLATTNSRGLVFAGVYTTVLGIALSFYGSTVVVGFMSAKGEYIPPCFSFRDMSLEDEEGNNDEDSTTGPRKLWWEKIHRGIFLGGLVIFSNLMLLCAVIFGELQVHDNYNNYDEQKHHNLFSYRIERISSVFAITCVVLAFVYILFAVIYTTCGGMSDDNFDLTQSIPHHQRHQVGGWDNQLNYEMSSQSSSRQHRHGRNSRRHHRPLGPNSMDKAEPLVGSGMHTSVGGHHGITDNEGFITDMVSTSSSESIGSHSWERGKQFSGQLS